DRRLRRVRRLHLVINAYRGDRSELSIPGRKAVLAGAVGRDAAASRAAEIHRYQRGRIRRDGAAQLHTVPCQHLRAEGDLRRGGTVASLQLFESQASPPRRQRGTLQTSSRKEPKHLSILPK